MASHFPAAGLLLSGLLLAAPAVAADDATADAPPVARPYRSPLATALRQRAVTASLPFDKGWDALTPAQRVSVRSLYDQLPASEEPPFPVQGLQSLYQPLNAVLEKRADEGGTALFGRLDMSVNVDAEGRVSAVGIYQVPDPAVAQAFSRLLLDVRFKPGMCAGKPCASEFPIVSDLNTH